MPTITFDFPDTFVCNVKGQPFPIDMRDWDVNGYVKAFAYGVQRSHNDCCGSADKEASDYKEQCLALAQKKYDSLKAGTARTHTVAPRGDAVAREATRLAEIAFKGYSTDTRRKAISARMAKDGIEEADAKRAILADLIESRGLKAQAETNLAAVKDMGEVDLAELGL